MRKLNFSKKIFIPFLTNTYKISPPENTRIFESKLKEALIIEGLLFFLYVVVSLKMNNKSVKTLNFTHLAHTAAFAVFICLKILMNVKSAKNLEFIQITRSSRGQAKSQRPRRQVKKDRRRSCCYVENVFGRQRRHRALQPAAVEGVVWIHSIIKNKPNFSHFFTQKHRFNRKTNPIQTQFKTNFGPLSRDQTQTNPTCRGVALSEAGFKPKNQSSITISYGTTLKYFINKTWANAGFILRKYYNKVWLF